MSGVLFFGLLATMCLLWWETHRHNSLRRELVDRGLISNVIGDAYVADWAHWKIMEENAAEADTPPTPET